MNLALFCSLFENMLTFPCLILNQPKIGGTYFRGIRKTLTNVFESYLVLKIIVKFWERKKQHGIFLHSILKNILFWEFEKINWTKIEAFWEVFWILDTVSEVLKLSLGSEGHFQLLKKTV